MDKSAITKTAAFERAVAPFDLPAGWTGIIVGITETQAHAVVESTRNQFAVPARQETFRHALTVGLVAVVAIWLLWLLGRAISNNSEFVVPLLWTISAVVAVLGAERIVTAIMKQLKKPTTSE
ncbi:MAG: hypothetical protein ABSA52_10200 [Candidatus Binatia bacterium]|jgi:hypothetical protein